LQKGEVIELCLRSLANSIRNCSYETRLWIADDHSSAATVEQMHKICQGLTYTLMMIEGTGNNASLQFIYNYARANFKGLIYFVEDDYLHHPQAVEEIIDFYQQYSSRTDLVIHPCDYPDRYVQIYPSNILLGRYRHWRTIRHTTYTLAMSHTTLERFWSNYTADVRLGEDATINRVYDYIPCFSPMPSLAIHLQFENTLSPYINWKDWVIPRV